MEQSRSRVSAFYRIPDIIGQSEVTAEQAQENRRRARETSTELDELEALLIHDPELFESNPSNEARLDALRRTRRAPRRPRPGKPALVPVCESSWWHGVAQGRYPAGVKLSPRVTAWRKEDIDRLLNVQRSGAAEDQRAAPADTSPA